ncbi:MAG: hypothetical protein KAV82_04005 [Phycisphaerae bacterium]|nr:hypothetical protein [Phycisphaerae bacterium]
MENVGVRNGTGVFSGDESVAFSGDESVAFSGSPTGSVKREKWNAKNRENGKD